jgi:hypothetical protein
MEDINLSICGRSHEFDIDAFTVLFFVYHSPKNKQIAVKKIKKTQLKKTRNKRTQWKKLDVSRHIYIYIYAYIYKYIYIYIWILPDRVISNTSPRSILAPPKFLPLRANVNEYYELNR